MVGAARKVRRSAVAAGCGITRNQSSRPTANDERADESRYRRGAFMDPRRRARAGCGGGVVGTPGLGQVTGAGGQRVGQFALRYTF